MKYSSKDKASYDVTSTGSSARSYHVSNRYVVLVLLTLTYALSGADRQMISVLAEPIKNDLLLSDGQLGLLTGLIFSLFYTCFGIPIAWLADRRNRVRIVAGACVLWSLFTAASGMAQNFVQLALARVGIGIGEAGGTAPSHSLISDYFPPEQRGKALGIYQVGLSIGIAFSVWLGGWIATEHDWRTAFFAVSAPGILLGLIVWFYIKHPERGRLDPPRPGGNRQPAPPLLKVFSTFFGTPTLVATVAGSCLAAFTCYGFMAWTPAFLMRNKGMSLMELSGYYSLVSGFAMIFGKLGSGWLVDYFGKRTKRAYGLIPAIASIIAAPLLLVALWVPDWKVTLILLVIPFALMMMWLPSALATVYNTVPPEQRTTAGAIFILLTSIMGSGAGPTFVGFLSDYYLRFDTDDSLKWALTSLIPFFLLAAIAYFITSLVMVQADNEISPGPTHAGRCL